ncbi:hypothetical protein OIU76_021030 [Salix suchowensis]|nr:hypothetical protein OIU76_021030 [Salix suchowensis]
MGKVGDSLKYEESDGISFLEGEDPLTSQDCPGMLLPKSTEGSNHLSFPDQRASCKLAGTHFLSSSHPPFVSRSKSILQAGWDSFPIKLTSTVRFQIKEHPASWDSFPIKLTSTVRAMRYSTALKLFLHGLAEGSQYTEEEL